MKLKHDVCTHMVMRIYSLVIGSGFGMRMVMVQLFPQSTYVCNAKTINQFVG